MSQQSSTNVVQALDRIRETLGTLQPTVGYHFPQLANGPIEQVLSFNNNETIQLKNLTGDINPSIGPYFSSHGILTDVYARPIPGSKVETTFPVDDGIIAAGNLFPPKQPAPFDRPPLDKTNTTENGYSKQAYYFPDGYFVTVGPSLPKILPLANGGAQFWVGSIGVITQGTGVFEGVKGETTYVGSAYLEHWPDNFDEQAVILAKGFSANIGTFCKFVPKKYI